VARNSVIERLNNTWGQAIHVEASQTIKESLPIVQSEYSFTRHLNTRFRARRQAGIIGGIEGMAGEERGDAGIHQRL
jgi:hypothetical protein